MKKLILFLASVFIFSCAFRPATTPLEIDKPQPTTQVREPLPFIVADQHEGEFDIKEALHTWKKLGASKVMAAGMPMLVGFLGNPKVDWSQVDLTDENKILAVEIPQGEITAFVLVFIVYDPAGNGTLIGYIFNTNTETITYMINNSKTKYAEKDRKSLIKIKGIVIKNGIEI